MNVMQCMSFAGVEIRHRFAGDDWLMLNLTDMWRAAGEDPSKQPARWVKLDETVAYLSEVREKLPNGSQPPISASRGVGGGTWAHRLVAVAYAQYLRPDFHLWCNEQIVALIEGRLAHHDPNSIAEQITRGLMPIVQPLVEGQQRLLESQAKTNERLEHVEKRIDQVQQTLNSVVKRVRVPAWVKVAHRRDVSLLGGRCPCCGMVEIVDGDGRFIAAEFDHYYAANRAKDHEVWPICVECHDGKTRSRDWQSERRPEFEAYQSRRTRLPGSQVEWVS